MAVELVVLSAADEVEVGVKSGVEVEVVLEIGGASVGGLRRVGWTMVVTG